MLITTKDKLLSFFLSFSKQAENSIAIPIISISQKKEETFIISNKRRMRKTTLLFGTASKILEQAGKKASIHLSLFISNCPISCQCHLSLNILFLYTQLVPSGPELISTRMNTTALLCYHIFD